MPIIARSATPRLWIQAACAAIAIAAGALAISGSIAGVLIESGSLHPNGLAVTPDPNVARLMVGTTLMDTAFGFGCGLAVATVLEAIARRSGRRNHAGPEASPIGGKV